MKQFKSIRYIEMIDPHRLFQFETDHFRLKAGKDYFSEKFVCCIHDQYVDAENCSQQSSEIFLLQKSFRRISPQESILGVVL